MNLDQSNINMFLNKYVVFVDEISDYHHYNSNIRHLLYLIVPSFIYKYGVSYESLILKCFRETEIYVTENKDNFVTASFNRLLKKENNEYYTEKYILINDYSSTDLSTLIDDIVHEINHAVNSINNEIFYDDKYVYVRTGLSKLVYDKKTLNIINKSDEITLEEILNTNDTEEVINVINMFSKFNIDNNQISNLIYALNGEIKGNMYESNAYSYQKYVCKSLIDNKTFTPTIKNLRIKGYINDIPNLFDSVIGINGSYDKLNKTLTDMHKLIVRYSNSKFFKKILLSKIKDKALIINNLINEYERKCIFK